MERILFASQVSARACWGWDDGGEVQQNIARHFAAFLRVFVSRGLPIQARQFVPHVVRHAMEWFMEDVWCRCIDRLAVQIWTQLRIFGPYSDEKCTRMLANSIILRKSRKLPSCGEKYLWILWGVWDAQCLIHTPRLLQKEEVILSTNGYICCFYNEDGSCIYFSAEILALATIAVRYFLAAFEFVLQNEVNIAILCFFENF